MSATQNALAGLQQLDMRHRHAPLEPHHSQGVASSLVKRFETIRQPVPVAVQRFQDRAHGVKGHYGVHDKLARDLYGAPDYRSLNPAQQGHVSQKESELRSNPAESHPYTQKGFTFGQARHVLMGHLSATECSGFLSARNPRQDFRTVRRARIGHSRIGKAKRFLSRVRGAIEGSKKRTPNLTSTGWHPQHN